MKTKRHYSCLAETDDPALLNFLANPANVITIDRDMLASVKIEHVCSRADWINMNGLLIRDLGPEVWLEHLLDALSGKIPNLK